MGTKCKIVIVVASMLLSVLFHPFVYLSDDAEGIKKSTEVQGVVAKASKTTSGSGISEDKTEKYQVRIYVLNELTETRTCSYGEKITLSNYIYNGIMVDT